MNMHCTSCGNEIPEGVKFCGACGKSLVQPAQPQQAVTQQPVTQAKPQQAVPPVSSRVQAPVNNQPAETTEEAKPSSDGKYAVMSVGSYMGSMLVMGIPLIGWIIAIVWACGGTKKVNKKNLARATIIWTIIIIGIFALIGFAINSLAKMAWKGISEAAGISENFSVTSLIGGGTSTGEGTEGSTNGGNFDISSLMGLLGGENGGIDLNALQNMENTAVPEY